MKWNYSLAIVLCIIVSSCKKDQEVQEQHETNILTYSIQNSPAEVSIVPLEHSINIWFPDSLLCLLNKV
jgi:hypothetical protein